MESLNFGYIYLLRFPNGKAYVGQTRKTAEQRFKNHIRAAKAGSGSFLYKAWRKYGAPELTVLGYIHQDDLNTSEIAAILAWDTLTPQGYNTTRGGNDSPGHSEIVREKLRRAQTGKKRSPEACINIGNSSRGRVKPASARATMSASRKAHLTPEYLAALSIKMKGNTHAKGTKMSPEVLAKRKLRITLDETKLKISLANKGRIVSEETKAKISAANKGRKHSEEYKEACRTRAVGRKHSEEAKIKMSEGLVIRHAKRKLLQSAAKQLNNEKR